MTSTHPGPPHAALLRDRTGLAVADFAALPPLERTRLVEDAGGDLHDFVHGSSSLAARRGPEATRRAAAGLFAALEADARVRTPADALASRLVTDTLLREECEHDQNVYMGPLFTRRLTQAVPDLLFLPVDRDELGCALAWARTTKVPVTVRGAASTAMGGAVPAEAGLALDLARLDSIEVDADAKRVRLGAGARMRPLHERIAAHELALPVYPSNLGGTFAGWLSTGGIGLNAFGQGRAIDAVATLELLLPGGELVRLHADRASIDHFDAGEWRELDEAASRAWFEERGLEPLGLNDIAGSEGQLGVIVTLELVLRERPELWPVLHAFEDARQAFEALADLRAAQAPGGVAGEGAPADLKYLDGEHFAHLVRVWREEDAKEWTHDEEARRRQGLPWRAVHTVGGVHETPRDAFPFELYEGRLVGQSFVYALYESEGRAHAAAERLAQRAASTLDTRALARRFSEERFRPQQAKRLGPGLLAAEVSLPAEHVEAYLKAARPLARRAGVELEAEVYHLADGEALALMAYLVDHRRGDFQYELVVAPALLDLAMARFEGRPYVLGRWQANLFSRRFDEARADHLRALKRSHDSESLLGRGAFFDMGVHGIRGALLHATLGPAVRIFRWLTSYVPGAPQLARAVLARFDGPAAGRGAPLEHEGPVSDASERALTCVNCGECNAVCPIFHEAGIRLPQVLTHIGEGAHAGEAIDASGAALLDLCMRCGNCQEVCQAGIDHLPLYRGLQARANETCAPSRDGHVLLLERLRSSTRYTRAFLDVRSGGYDKRANVALPGVARYLLLRAEDDAGPASTCIHCAACVDVCPTGANREYEGEDARWITTVQERCIGCGTCVEVCPANLANGGRTLRVMDAPTLDWFEALRAFDANERQERV